MQSKDVRRAIVSDETIRLTLNQTTNAPLEIRQCCDAVNGLQAVTIDKLRLLKEIQSRIADEKAAATYEATIETVTVESVDRKTGDITKEEKLKNTNETMRAAAASVALRSNDLYRDLCEHESSTQAEIDALNVRIAQHKAALDEAKNQFVAALSRQEVIAGLCFEFSGRKMLGEAISKITSSLSQVAVDAALISEEINNG